MASEEPESRVPVDNLVDAETHREREKKEAALESDRAANLAQPPGSRCGDSQNPG